MGKTGVGKSTFIKAATRLDITTGHHLDSCKNPLIPYPPLPYPPNLKKKPSVEPSLFPLNKGTAIPQIYPVPNTTTFLVDTPGFDDPSLSDTSVLQSIASCLADISEGLLFPNLTAQISGIIFMQAINESRMTGTKMRNLAILRLLVGEGNMEHCVLVTTKWGLEESDVAERREAELIQTKDYWGCFLAEGAGIERYGDSHESALVIMQASTRRGRFVPRLMQEYAVDGMELSATAAGRAIEGDVARARERNEQELETLRAEYKSAMDEDDAKSTAAVNAVRLRIESLKVLDEETEQLHATRSEAQKQLDEFEEAAARTHHADDDVTSSTHLGDDGDEVSISTSTGSSDDGSANLAAKNNGRKTARSRTAKHKKHARRKRALRWFGRFAALGGTVAMSVLTSGAMAPVGVSLMGLVEWACQEDKNREAMRNHKAERA
ncbi:MAG: hypothetical protein L6R36_008438 [Xanthoria steineri]|nr:MAG: hypothetical protein L6R36_008438 [Xanthoria steineri]